MANEDFFNILLDGASLTGGFVHPGDPLPGGCTTFTYGAIAHTAGAAQVTVIGDPSAASEQFGVSFIELEYC